jgi:hypothetical protein
MKSSTFWDVALCSPPQINGDFGRTCCLRLQGRRISSAFKLLHITFLLGLFFGTEDVGEMFLRNVILFSTDYMALYREGRTAHNHCCETLKTSFPLKP